MNAPIQRRLQIAEVFRKRFDSEPSHWQRAPGRVDLMGSHTDYNLGYVLTMAVDLDIWIAARVRPDRVVRVYSLNLDSENSFSLEHIIPDSQARWSNYIRGVAQVLQENGLNLSGFDGVIHGAVPIGSGLSSSAALECATAGVFEALGGWRLDPQEKALLCQRAENQFVGVNCGILDQYTSCLGKKGCALLLDCRDLSSRPVEIAAGIEVVICNTRFKRELAGSEYGRRRAQCEEGARRLGLVALREISARQFYERQGELPDDVARRCRFIVEENERVTELAKALQYFDRQAIRNLTEASFCGACELYEIGVPAMHAMMKAMLSAPGIIGARQAGAGFGGCMVAFVEKESVGEFAESVQGTYFQMTNIQPEVYLTQAAAGADALSPELHSSNSPGLNPADMREDTGGIPI